MVDVEPHVVHVCWWLRKNRSDCGLDPWCLLIFNTWSSSTSNGTWAAGFRARGVRYSASRPNSDWKRFLEHILHQFQVDADLHGWFLHHVVQPFRSFNVEGTHQQYPLSKQELLHGGEDSQSFRPILIVHIVVAGMTIHQSPHPIISCNHDTKAPQDVGWIHGDVLNAWSDTMKSWVLAERHKNWSCRQLVDPSDRFSEPLCIVPLDPNVIWMSVCDEECKWYPEMDGHILLGRNVWHHALDQVLDCIEELLGSGHALEAVDVDDRDDISHLIEPVLDVRRPPWVRLALVVEVCDQNGLAEPELSCQFILFLSHHWLVHNGPTDARHQASLPLVVVAVGGLCIIVLLHHDCHGPNREIVVLVNQPPTLRCSVVDSQPFHVAERVGCFTNLPCIDKSEAQAGVRSYPPEVLTPSWLRLVRHWSLDMRQGKLNVGSTHMGIQDWSHLSARVVRQHSAICDHVWRCHWWDVVRCRSLTSWHWLRRRLGCRLWRWRWWSSWTWRLRSRCTRSWWSRWWCRSCLRRWWLCRWVRLWWRLVSRWWDRRRLRCEPGDPRCRHRWILDRNPFRDPRSRRFWWPNSITKPQDFSPSTCSHLYPRLFSTSLSFWEGCHEVPQGRKAFVSFLDLTVVALFDVDDIVAMVLQDFWSEHQRLLNLGEIIVNLLYVLQLPL